MQPACKAREESPADDRPAGIIRVALARFSALAGYRALIRSRHPGGSDEIRYHYQRPGFVRIDCITPHKGTTLIYSPETRRVRLWPPGILPVPPLVLRPANPLIVGRTGQRIDRSDIGTLLESIEALRRCGRAESCEGERGNEQVTVAADNGAGGPVHRYDVWFDSRTALPTRVVSYDRNGGPIEDVAIEQLEINPQFPRDFFSSP